MHVTSNCEKQMWMELEGVNHALVRLFHITVGLKSIHIYDCNEHRDDGNQERGSTDQVF